MPTKTKPKHTLDLIASRRSLYPISKLLAARLAYVHGDASLSAISRNFSLPMNTLKDLSSKEDWPTRRKLFTIAAAQAADQAALDGLRYPGGARPAAQGPGQRQIERCNAALANCHDPTEAIAWMKVLESAQRVAFLDTHGHLPPQGKPQDTPKEATDQPQARAPGSFKAIPLADDPDGEDPAQGNDV